MGVWDMMYLVQQYKKALRLAENQNFSEKTRSEFSLKAEHLRLQMARYLERAQKDSEVRALLKEVKR
jgi:exonuclease I